MDVAVDICRLCKKSMEKQYTQKRSKKTRQQKQTMISKENEIVEKSHVNEMSFSDMEKEITMLRNEMSKKDVLLEKTRIILERKKFQLARGKKREALLQHNLEIKNSMLDKEDKLWNSPLGSRRHESPQMQLRAINMKYLDMILNDKDRLYALTGFYCNDFGEILDFFVDGLTAMEKQEIQRIGEEKEENAKEEEEPKVKVPLLRNDPIRSTNPGNRCSLDPKHILLLALIRKYKNANQDMLASFFGIDQAAVSRYQKLADRVMERFLPTPQRIMQALCKITNTDAFLKLFPDNKLLTMLIDGTLVRFQRPQDKDRRKKMYSGKKKTYSANTILLTDPNGLILATSDTVEGTTHDLNLTRSFIVSLGEFAQKVMIEPSSTEEKIRLLADLGFLGLDKILPSTDVIVPIRKPKKGELTPEQKAHNKTLSSERVQVENTIGAAKHFKRASQIYEGTLEEFQREFNIVAGLANLRTMKRQGTYYSRWKSFFEELGPPKDNGSQGGKLAAPHTSSSMAKNTHEKNDIFDCIYP